MDKQNDLTVNFSKDEINALRLIMDSEVEENKKQMEKYLERLQSSEINQNEATLYKVMADGYRAQYEVTQHIVRKINDAFAKGR